jgi:hypothetical protein
LVVHFVEPVPARTRQGEDNVDPLLVSDDPKKLRASQADFVCMKPAALEFPLQGLTWFERLNLSPGFLLKIVVQLDR